MAIALGLVAGSSPVTAQDGLLEARLYEPIGSQVQFTVSRPAYVAIFEILPGSGMTMLHPWTTYGTQRRFSPGSHSFVPQRTSFHRSSYTFGSHSRFSSPITLLLIASERPLRLSSLPRAPMALLNQFGFYSYQPAATLDAVERLASRIVPDADHTDWTYDSYIIWPESHTPVLAMHPVICADGQVRYIIGGRLPAGCLTPPAATAPDSAKPPQRDSIKTRVRRTPQQTREWTREKPGIEQPRSRGTASGATRKPSGTAGAPSRRPQSSGGASSGGAASASGGRKSDAAPSPRPAPSSAPAPAPAAGGSRGSRASEVPNN